jgi:hypothetical protein
MLTPVKIPRTRTFPFAGQIPCGCKPLYQSTLTETFYLNTGEEFRRKEPEFKVKENEI